MVRPPQVVEQIKKFSDRIEAMRKEGNEANKSMSQ